MQALVLNLRRLWLLFDREWTHVYYILCIMWLFVTASARSYIPVGRWTQARDRTWKPFLNWWKISGVGTDRNRLDITTRIREITKRGQCIEGIVRRSDMILWGSRQWWTLKFHLHNWSRNANMPTANCLTEFIDNMNRCNHRIILWFSKKNRIHSIQFKVKIILEKRN